MCYLLVTLVIYVTVLLQVTHHQLSQLREAEESQKEKEAREREMAAKREVSADAYSRLVDVENANRQDDGGTQGEGGVGRLGKGLAGTPCCAAGMGCWWTQEIKGL